MKQRKTKIAGIFPPGPQKDPIRAAADYGIDIHMLLANLARTPAERIRRHQIALETFRAFRKAKRVGSLDETKDIGGGRQIRVHTVDSLIKMQKKRRKI